MLDLFPEDDMTTWKLFISYPKDCQDYNIFMKRLESSTEAFKWSDVTKIGDGFVDAIDKSDALIVLSGLWDDDKELIEKHIKYAKGFRKPIIIIRPYGVDHYKMLQQRLLDGILHVLLMQYYLVSMGKIMNF